MKTSTARLAACAASLTALTSTAFAQSLGTNLLVNPGADTGPGAADASTYVPVPGWVQSGNVSAVAYGAPGFLSVASPGSANRGANMFSSGPPGGGSTLSQEVDLRPLRETIMAGGTVAQFAAWLGGVGPDSGTVSLSLELLDSTYNLLSTTTLDAVTPAERGGVSRMLKRRTDLPVPATARLARVKMSFSGNVDGKSGLADDVRLVLSTPTAAPSGMTHRWSFFTLPGAVANGTVIPDTIGTAHATVRGAGATSTSSYGPAKALRLPGGSSATAAYVDLPNGLVSSQTQLTIEGWYSVASFSGFWTRFFEFGTGTAGELTGPGGAAATGTVSLIGLAHSANGLTQQGLHWQDPAILPDGYLQALTNAPQTLSVPAHVVYTFDNSTPGSTAITYYRDGVLKTSATVSRNLSDIPDVNSWLGRSNWTNEPNLHGTLDEVRLYNRILVQPEIIASRAAGPDASQPDADNDGLPDAHEQLYAFLNKTVTTDAATDADGDTLSNLTEFQRATNPAHGDSDGDGLGDQTETMTGMWVDGLHRGTHPLSTDSDSDGLADGVETNTGVFVVAGNTGTNPNKPDTDGDGFNDGYEVTVANPGTSPVAPDFGGMGWQNLPDVTGPIPALQHDSNWAYNSSFQPGDARYFNTSNDGGGTWTIPFYNVWGHRSNFAWPGTGSIVTIGQGNNPTPPSTVTLSLGPVGDWQNPEIYWAGRPGSLQLNRLNMNGGTLTFTGGVSTLSFDGDSIWAGGNAFADQGGSRYWNRGRLQITGNMTANHLLNTNIIRLTGGYLDVNGYANSGFGNLENRSSQAQLGGDPSVAEIRLEVDADLTSAPNAPGVIHNRGVIRKSGGTGVSTIAAALTNFDIGENNEDGVIDVQSGTVRIATTASPRFFGLDARVSSSAVLELGTVLPSNQPHLVTGTLRGSGTGKVRLTSWMQDMGFTPSNAPVPVGVLDFPAGMFEMAGGTFSQGNGGKPVRNVGFVQVTAPSAINGSFQNENQMIVNADLSGGHLINGIILPGSDTAIVDFKSDSSLTTSNVTNRGTIRKSGGTGISTIGAPGFATFVNEALPGQPGSGKFEVSSGTLRMGPQTTFTANNLDVSLANSSVMQILRGLARPNGSDPVLQNSLLPVNVSGTGSLEMRDEPFGDASYRLLRFNTSGATVIKVISAKLSGCDNEGAVVLNGANVLGGTVNHGLIYAEGNGANFVNFLNDSTAAAGSPVTVPEVRIVGAVTMTGSSSTNRGLIRKTNAGTAALNLASFRNTGTIRVENGSLAITPGAFAYFDGETFANGVLKEGRYEVFSVLDTGNIPPYDAQLISTNRASILLSGAAATWPQLATLRSNEGTLEIAAGASLTTTTAPGQVFTNSGQLTLNGTSLNVPDAATLSSAGTFSSHIAANPAAAGSTGRLTAAGALTVGGTLEVWCNLPTAPGAATRWKIAQGSSRTGTFSTVRFVNPPAGWGGMVDYLADGVEVGLTPVNPANTIATWTAAQSFPSAPAALPLADPDNDGVSNLMEAAVGTNPRSAGASNPATLQPARRNGASFLAFTYTRPGPATRPRDILYVCEQSADLTTWTCGTLVEEVSLPDANGNESVTVRQSTPAGSQARGYLRLRVEKAP